MARLLFRLSNVPDEEIVEVRQLLEAHGFDTYETRAGFWGLGVAAIWLRDETQYEAARQVLDDYQEALGARMRQERDRLASRGEAPTLGGRLLRHPLRVGLVTIAALAIIAISVLPFLGLIDGLSR
ncbi:DUF6164 family protein [Halomonas urumqiensis]|uniref:DUF2007 domain-containing protein n=1 Tax=Halomonas urumqiensis TaxID=1684789 RepID=A0A2N7UKB6_9GAMM|nr:DUF6164 family protein [Halomonas urumqiensis]PMR80871.1 hypothetical protein C1H70_07345 [Halomonas urumqiensis]PTB02828.1 hypothetical protein C6V82_09345 [Halomonas urumqiensis]GHE21337.1 hypothetical protein GCM10017767_18580 [Halomonas urumqiensis]